MDRVWEQLHATRGWGKYPSDSLIATVMRSYRDLEVRQKTRVLEMGCGAGANLSFFLNEGFQVYGIDGAPSAIANAKSRLETLKASDQILDLKTCTFESIDFEDDSFNLIVDYFAIYANPVPVIHATYAEVKRMCKSGGRFYSRVWGASCEGAASGEMIEPGTSRNPTAGPCKDMGVSHFFTYAELCDLFADWSSAEITRHITQSMSNPDNIIEEWVVWATK